MSVTSFIRPAFFCEEGTEKAGNTDGKKNEKKQTRRRPEIRAKRRHESEKCFVLPT